MKFVVLTSYVGHLALSGILSELFYIFSIFSFLIASKFERSLANKSCSSRPVKNI